MGKPEEQTPPKLAQGPQEGGEIRSQRWEWVEPAVWTERMLATLETGIEGGKWDHQKWPNAYFTAMGLFSLKQAHLAACRSL